MVLIFPSVLLWVWAESPGLFFIYVPPGYRQADIRHGREGGGCPMSRTPRRCPRPSASRPHHPAAPSAIMLATPLSLEAQQRSSSSRARRPSTSGILQAPAVASRDGYEIPYFPRSILVESILVVHHA
ncbi:hypothetical protein AcV7_008919 [Taiwanofungus camphoratus]|nr:hypothetical protein AcW2_004592 [Antrodia cinnamomea]KAI0950460.1 hypothetical protein AcV7_008919 [Antrodia cinnamomea]